MYLVAQNHMGRGNDTPLNLRVARNRNGLRALTTQESHGFSRVECQRLPCYLNSLIMQRKTVFWQ
jgi:hypothetical protein